MKKILSLLTLVIVAISIGGCGNIDLSSIRESQLTSHMSEEAEKITEMSNEIIRCFIERDKDALKGLFCEQTQNQPGFDNEIDNAFDFLQCESYTTSEIDTSASGNESIREGKRVMWSVQPEIPYFKVWAGREHHYYSIRYSWLIINDEDASKVGLGSMTIELLNIESIHIG